MREEGMGLGSDLLCDCRGGGVLYVLGGLNIPAQGS